ncbi:MAG: hypothetical protein ACOY3K_02575 [Candidatus Omnitrophota bacterium]
MFRHFKKNLSKQKQSSASGIWAVIIEKPLDAGVHSKIAEKIAEIFSVGVEEATRVVENTPIILLDQLSQPMAIRLKDLLKPAGAEILITSEWTVKSKCFKAVWSEIPDLTVPQEPNEVLPSEAAVPASEESSEPVLPAQETSGQTVENAEMYTDPKVNPPLKPEEAGGHEEREFLEENLKSWKDKCEMWKRSLDLIVNEAMSLKGERESFKEDLRKTELFIEQQERRVRQKEMLFRGYQEKQQHLQESSLQYRKSFEIHLNRFSMEMNEWKKKLDDAFSHAQKLEAEKQRLYHELEGEREKKTEVEKEYEELQRRFVEELSASKEEISQWKQIASDMHRKIENLQGAHENLEQALKDQQRIFAEMGEELEPTKAATSSNAGLHSQEYQTWISNEKAVIKRLEMLEKIQNQVISDLQKRLKEDWISKARHLDQELNLLSEHQEQLHKIMTDSPKPQG